MNNSPHTEQDVSTKSYLWEELVTDGHVRAARIRLVRGRVVALSLVLLVVAVVITAFGVGIRAADSKAITTKILNQHFDDYKKSVEEIFSQMPKYHDLSDEEKKIMVETPFILNFIKSHIAKLNSDEPDEQEYSVVLKKVSKNDFWKEKLESGKITYVSDGDVQIYGALACYIDGYYTNGVFLENRYPDEEGRPCRRPTFWLGVFKKINGKWKYASIGISGGFKPNEHESVDPNEILETLKDMMP